MRTIVYLHGFISSPQSKKAVMLGDYLRQCVTGVDYIVPEMHHRPKRAIEEVESACLGIARADLTLVGSSLGGFYATVIAERLGCRAALLNPAVHPQRHFTRYLGAQRNLHTGESFELTRVHVEELDALDPHRITRPGRYWLFVETGDEVLDYREAVKLYAGAVQEVVRGGDHTLVSFPEHVPEIVDWAATDTLSPVLALKGEGAT
ncbi:MAG: YqiA/YcfP family alpha/beta fold hydrolase [Usitatibacter sp.]